MDNGLLTDGSSTKTQPHPMRIQLYCSLISQFKDFLLQVLSSVSRSSLHLSLHRTELPYERDSWDQLQTQSRRILQHLKSSGNYGPLAVTLRISAFISTQNTFRMIFFQKLPIISPKQH